MQLASFLNKVFKKGGFILTDANSKDYIIGNPGNNPINLKIFPPKKETKLIGIIFNIKYKIYNK